MSFFVINSGETICGNIAGTGIFGIYYPVTITTGARVGNTILCNVTSNIDFYYANASDGHAGTKPCAGQSIVSLFGGYWNGTITFPSTAVYQLNVQSDDGVNMTIGTTQLINSYKPQTSTFTPTFSATAGVTYPFSLTYFQNQGSAWIHVAYVNSGVITPIPASWYGYYGCTTIPQFGPSGCATTVLASQTYDGTNTNFCYNVTVVNGHGSQCAVSQLTVPSFGSPSCSPSSSPSQSTIAPGGTSTYCWTFSGFVAGVPGMVTLTLPNQSTTTTLQIATEIPTCASFVPCTGPCSS